MPKARSAVYSAVVQGYRLVKQVGRTWLRARAFTVSNLSLSVGGFGAIAYGVHEIYGPAGWIAAGILTLVMNEQTQKPDTRHGGR